MEKLWAPWRIDYIRTKKEKDGVCIFCIKAEENNDRENLVLNQHVDDSRIDLDDAVDIELHPGQFSLHDVFLIHGSNPNTSGKRRAGVAIRYMPATSHFNRSLYETSEGSGYLVNFATRG